MIHDNLTWSADVKKKKKYQRLNQWHPKQIIIKFGCIIKLLTKKKDRKRKSVMNYVSTFSHQWSPLPDNSNYNNICTKRGSHKIRFFSRIYLYHTKCEEYSYTFQTCFHFSEFKHIAVKITPLERKPPHTSQKYDFPLNVCICVSQM